MSLLTLRFQQCFERVRFTHEERLSIGHGSGQLVEFAFRVELQAEEVVHEPIQPEISESGPASPSYPWLTRRAGNAIPAPVVESSRDSSALNRHLFKEVRVTNIPSVLMHQDLCSMAHGVESRAPFLDHRIVEYCFGLPSSYKVRHGERKRMLLRGARHLLPGSVLSRTDKKTPVSRIDWMPLREHRQSELREMASSHTIRECPWIEGSRVAPWVDSYLRGEHQDVLSIWRLYTAWRWLEIIGSA